MTLSKFGRYEIVNELGQGGMAEVYQARDPMMDRLVALKIIRKNFSQDSRFHDRFWREAKTIASLEHRAIVPVHDFGADEPTGQLYLVMRLMPDVLNKRLKREGAISLEDTSLILNRLAAALHTAHSRGLMHRDIKPANILLDDEGTVFLADFGLAASIDKIESGAVPAAYGGSMFYMAPEQWLDQPLGQYTDVYQLGVTLFEMLTGQRPFPEADMNVLFDRHVNGRIPDARALNPLLPQEIQPILEKAMAKDPGNRYKTVLELAEDVANLLRPKQIKRRYEIKEELQHGRFAVVYLAYDMFEDQQVALKIMKHPLLANQTYRQKFQRQRKQILAVPAHDAIIPVYDVDLHDEKPYIAMKFVEGASLRERFRKERELSLDVVCDIAKRLAEGLDSLHATQQVHGDINLGNVLMDSAGNCSLTDYHITAVAELTTAILEQNEPLGYLPYLSPEQWRSEPVLPQTDVYQFATLLFELLTGQRPFPEMAMAELQESVEKESPRKITSLKPELPPQFDDVFARALAKQPENRHAKAGDFVNDLNEAWQNYSFDALKHQGEAYYEAKQWDDAISAYERALKIRPDSKAVLAALERAERRKQDSGIFYQSKQAIEARRWTDAAYFLARASDTSEKKEMLDLVERKIRADQQYEAGKVAMQQQEWLKAQKLFDETDFLEPNYKDVNLLLGQLAEKVEGCVQQAREAAEQADYHRAFDLLKPIAEHEKAVALREEIAARQKNQRRERWMAWSRNKSIALIALLLIAGTATGLFLFFPEVLSSGAQENGQTVLTVEEGFACLETAVPQLRIINESGSEVLVVPDQSENIPGEWQALTFSLVWGPEDLSQSCLEFIEEDGRISSFWEPEHGGIMPDGRWTATYQRLSESVSNDTVVITLSFDNQSIPYRYHLSFTP
jgi:serine/threonine protein kinase